MLKTIIDRDNANNKEDSVIEDHLLLQARNVDFDWRDLPLRYVTDQPLATHFCNVLHILLPAGEYFFVECFKEALPLIKDDQLRADVQGFIGQEAMHAQAHEGLAEFFETHGMNVKPYVNQMNWLFSKLLGARPNWSTWAQEKWMLERVALVAAVEHYTAIIGKWILDAKAYDKPGVIHPVMLDLLRWHGSEEVEHKSVAFDVMKHFKAGLLRQARTQVVVTVFLLVLYVRGIVFLYSQDPSIPDNVRPRWRDWFRLAKQGLLPDPKSLFKQVARYYFPSFHPSELGGVEQAAEYLAKSPAARAAH